MSSRWHLPLACGIIALPVLLPPQLHPWSGAACRFLAALVAVLLALRSPRGRSFAPLGAALLVPMAAAAILGAACRSRAVDEAVTFAMLLLVGALGWVMSHDSRSHRALVVLLATLGTAVAIQAAIQHHVEYPAQAAMLRAEGTSPETDAFLVRLEAGRPSGPFTLPAALAGFLALSMPMTLVATRRAGHGWLRWAALAALLAQGYALFLSRSFGGLAAVAVAILVTVPALALVRSRALVACVLLVAVLGGGYFLHARLPEIGAGTGGDPVSLRVGNWRAAAAMVGDHPLLGTGPGSFAVFYPRYMRPGMNETRFAHNSYLQVLAGWGIWALLPLVSMVVLFLRAAMPAWRDGDARLPLVAGAAAFLFHNLFDFTAYLPGVAIPAALLVGSTLGMASQKVESVSPVGVSWRLTRFAITALIVAALVPQAIYTARAAVLMEEAREAAQRREVESAAEHARRAAIVRPADPEPWAFLAELVLSHWMEDAERRDEGERAAARAVFLDPESAILHYTRSLYHHADGREVLAHREQRRARLLHPLKPLYRTTSAESKESPR